MSKFIIYDALGWFFAGYENDKDPVYASSMERAKLFGHREVAEATAAYCASLNQNHKFSVIEVAEPLIPAESAPAQKAPVERTVRDLELTVNEYQKLAARTINRNLAPQGLLINGVMGLCGEAGEAIDIVKKHIAQGHDLDREGLIKELGDVAWYLAETATALNVTLEQVLRTNIDKLRARYPEGFEAEKSVYRREGDV